MADVEINLDGKTETLRCTPEALKKVNSRGGMQHVSNRLQAADFEYFVLAAEAGLGRKFKDLEGALYRAGMPAIGPKLYEYVQLLANGGKPFRPKKLKTVEIEGVAYAELGIDGEPVYVDDEPAGDETAGEE